MTKTNSISEASSDPFFTLSGNPDWNACIGPQGSEEYYIEGYLEAALMLASDIIKNNLMGQRDTLAMPILYNARHGMELCLKFALKRFAEFGVLGAEGRKDHDILRQWERLTSAPVGDEKTRELAASLHPFVASLSQIDSTGESFRYHENKAGDPVLADKPLVNLYLVRDSLKSLQEILLALKERTNELKYERGTGSFTPECSRRDLIAIAKILPSKDKWCEPIFDDAKKEIVDCFRLCGNAFSRAVDVIKSNREMKALIGEASPLIHLTETSALFLAEQWMKQYEAARKRVDNKPFTISSIDFEEMQRREKIKSEVNAAILEKLSLEETADAETLFYAGRDNLFPEYYEERLQTTIETYKLENALAVNVQHIISKTNFLDYLIVGILRMGAKDIARTLQKHRS